MPHQKKKRVLCPSCNTQTAANTSFCRKCRYPIHVKNLRSFTAPEIAAQLSHLGEVLTNDTPSFFTHRDTDELYDELLSLQWLRPESALFGFLEMRVLRELKEWYLPYPLLDLGCGDGLYAALLFGAKINKKYDAYEAIDFNKTDCYDAYARLPRDFFITQPSPIGFGVDIKKNAVLKARDLKIYDRVTVGNVKTLPFKKNSVQAVFSNMIDDINTEDLETVFNEGHRVLRNNGYFVFTTPNERFRKSLFYYHKAKAYNARGEVDASKLFTLLGRGRSEWEPRPLSLWLKLFKKTSFRLMTHSNYADTQVLQLWDTGFRPFFTYLLDMRNRLRKNDTLLPLKKIWVEILKHWLWHYTRERTANTGAFSVIVAKKM